MTKKAANPAMTARNNCTGMPERSLKRTSLMTFEGGRGEELDEQLSNQAVPAEGNRGPKCVPAK